jgi:hypothetical protein
VIIAVGKKTFAEVFFKARIDGKIIAVMTK